MVSLGIPAECSDERFDRSSDGFKDGMQEWGPRLIGGDTNEADDLIIDCILAGFADTDCREEGARPGELVVVTGDFGTTSAGLKILLEKAHVCRPHFGRRR